MPSRARRTPYGFFGFFGFFGVFAFLSIGSSKRVVRPDAGHGDRGAEATGPALGCRGLALSERSIRPGGSRFGLVLRAAAVLVRLLEQVDLLLEQRVLERPSRDLELVELPSSGSQTLHSSRQPSDEWRDRMGTLAGGCLGGVSGPEAGPAVRNRRAVGPRGLRKQLLAMRPRKTAKRYVRRRERALPRPRLIFGATDPGNGVEEA